MSGKLLLDRHSVPIASPELLLAFSFLILDVSSHPLLACTVDSERQARIRQSALSLFEFCMCMCAVPSIFKWSGNFKTHGYQTSAGWLVGWYGSEYTQPPLVRNLLWPTPNWPHILACYISFFVIQSEASEIGLLTFYSTDPLFVLFVFSDRDLQSSPGWPWLSIFSLRCPSARITGTCLHQLALSSHATYTACRLWL